jgi:hypothetical protein
MTQRDLRRGEFVRVTGGVSARGKVGQVHDLSDTIFVGIRIPNNRDATATTYLTKGSVESINGENGDVK